MKKIILFIILIISLFAEDSNNKDYKNNIESSNQFIQAKILYKEKEYQKSFELLKVLFLENPTNTDVNYYYAKSSSKMGKYDDAIGAYERVLIAKSDFVIARAEYARLLVLTGQIKVAKIEFKKVLSYELPNNVRKKILLIQEKLEKNSDSLFFASISFSYLYDDNINNVLEDSTYNSEFENDYGFGVFANLNHLKKFSDNSIFLKNNFLLYKKRIIDNNEYDIGYLAYKPSVIFKDSENKQSFSFGLGIGKLYSGDESDFKTYSINTEYKKNIDKFILSTKYVFQKNVFDKQVDKNRDFTRNNIDLNINIRKLSIYEMLIKDINLNSKYSLYRDINSSSIVNINKDTLEIKANLKYLLFYNIELFLEYKYKFSDYKDYKRKDNTNIFNLSVSKNLTSKDKISLSLLNKRNDSDIDLYSYDKNLFNVTYKRKIRW